MNKTKISTTFINLAEIPSPSGMEKEVASFIQKRFISLGWKTWIDETGNRNYSNTGNVYAYKEINKDYPTIMCSAHMDTVQKVTDKIKVLFDGNTFTSNGKTILGADNKAGVTTLLLTAENIDYEKLKVNLLFFFPTREESGIMGSSFFSADDIRIKYILNVDSSDKPGVFICKSLGYTSFTIEIKGIAAHAAKSYEKGKNAITIASDLIHALPQGKHEDFTLNISSIQGGMENGTNVVCDKVLLKGELRAYTLEDFETQKNAINKVCLTIATQYENTIKLEFLEKEYIPPFVGEKQSQLIHICKKACENLHISPTFIQSYSTSDANFYSITGIPTLSVSRGGMNGHAYNESLEFIDLVNSCKILEDILYLCS